MQGALLAMMLVIGLITGWLLAGAYGISAAPQAQPAFLTGKVQIERNGAVQPDAGAVLLLLPADNRPSASNKIPIVGLRPQDPPLDSNDATLSALRSIGGDVARTSGDGFFHLRVRATGRYFLLALSARAQRDVAEPLDRKMLAELGRYVDRANELLGSNAFEWRTVDIVDDQQLTITFR